MRVPDHQKELSRENLNKWLVKFLPKLKRTTTRTAKCRLICSIERKDFSIDEYAQYWKEVTFENGKCRVHAKNLLADESELTNLQAKTIKSNTHLHGKLIQREELRAERGSWCLPAPLTSQVISEGGEALVLSQTIAGYEIAVRVHAFDPFLFTYKEKLKNLTAIMHLSSDFEVANEMNEKTDTMPFHANIVRNFGNIEIYHKEDVEHKDCIGWITLMEKCNGYLRKKLRAETLSLQERKEIALGIQKGTKYLLQIGIEHNDLKPDNILLLDGVPKIIDFGLVECGSKKKSYRQAGYVRSGSKYSDFYNLCKLLKIYYTEILHF